MKNIFRRSFLILLFLSVYSSSSYALEVETHKAINKYIAQNTLNSFSLDSYLKNNLGLTKGKEEEFTSDKTRKVFEWLELGGEYEDIPAWYLQYIRSLNHFHNPITEEGFKGDCLQSSLCVSSTVWALMPLGTQSSTTGNYSWYDVRNYYFKALTSTDKTTRDTNFAQTFRGLGQLLHLVQDASVPSHTRNDFHFFKNFEDYAKSFVERLGVSPPTNSDFYNGTVNTIASFIDTNKYTGSNPGDVIGNTIGLSEYTNANFFSEDTIFSSSFPYPARSNIVEYWQDMGNGKKKIYLRKLGQGEIDGNKTGYGEHIEHLAAGRWLYKYLPEVIKDTGLTLDDNVYQDYASLLLPRAVGYSAGLLNYFFRGDFRIPNVSYTSTSITMWIMNKTYINPSDPVNSAIEPMGPGILVVSYSYKDSSGNTVYGVSGTVNVDTVPSARDNMYIEVAFPLNTSIPVDATDVSFILIFRGQLGNENDAIAAKATGDSFREEWNNGLKGNHTWLYSDADIINNLPNVGETVNTIQNERLIKENVRYAWKKSYSHINETYIGEAFVNPAGGDNTYCTNSSYNYCFPYDFGRDFPVPITPDTSLSIKIDAMNINQTMPSCSFIYSAYQGIQFTFRFEDGTYDSLFVTSEGNEFSGKNVYITAYLGQDVSMNIYGILEWFYGRSITGAVELIGINVVQKILSDCGYPEVEYRQHMEVDHIKVW